MKLNNFSEMLYDNWRCSQQIPEKKPQPICMRCGNPTDRVVLVGAVCEKCAVEVDYEEAAKKLNRALNWMVDRITQK